MFHTIQEGVDVLGHLLGLRFVIRFIRGQRKVLGIDVPCQPPFITA
jgi:hypothetical protein